MTLVILICALVQSVFGVGLLIFGTPTLLLLGYSFSDSLAYLLPCSIVISSLQVLDGKKALEKKSFKFVSILVPTVILGILLGFALGMTINFKPVIGGMLIFTALLRFQKSLQNSLRIFISKHLVSALAATGLIHGLTNMGGGLVTLICSTQFGPKEKIRAHIGLCYLTLAIFQFSVLILLKGLFFDFQKLLLLVAMTCVIYLSLGRRIFAVSQQALYEKMMSVVALLFGCVLLLQSILT